MNEEMKDMMNEMERDDSKYNPFAQSKAQQMSQQKPAFPSEVQRRLDKHSERTGESKKEVEQFYLNYIKENYDCDDWQQEDEDLLVDWAEQCFTILRRGTTGGGQNTTSFVGCFVGVDAKSDNRGTGLQNWLVGLYRRDPNEAMSKGAGHYVAQDGKWVIETMENGVITTNEDATEAPSMGIHVGGNDYICFVSRAGNPYSTDVMGRYAWFLGNEHGEFENDIKLWRVDLKGEDTERSLRIGEPCIITVRPPKEDASEYRKDILETNEGFVDTINYTDEFVAEDLRKDLHPSKFWSSTVYHELYVPLEELTEAYENGLRTFQSPDGMGKVGPLVITRGTVNRLNTEARESQYDQAGKQYSMSLTCMDLQSMYGQGAGSEVLCNVGSAVHDLTHPFTFVDKEGERYEYAENTTVFVFGRIGMMRRDSDETPKMTIFGVYADWRRARPRASGGNSNPSQFD